MPTKSTGVDRGRGVGAATPVDLVDTNACNPHGPARRKHLTRQCRRSTAHTNMRKRVADADGGRDGVGDDLV